MEREYWNKNYNREPLPVHGIELWMTDGTDSGTALVSDLNPSTRSFGGRATRVMKGLGNRLYFSASDALSGEELWVLQVPQPPLLHIEQGQNAIVIDSRGEPTSSASLNNPTDLAAWKGLVTNVAGANGMLLFTNDISGTNVFFRVRGLTSPP